LRQVLEAGSDPDPYTMIDQAMVDFAVSVAAVQQELALIAEADPLGEVASARRHLGVAFGHFSNGLTAEGRAELITARALLSSSDEPRYSHEWSL
jgi:hypothetical protein